MSTATETKTAPTAQPDLAAAITKLTEVVAAQGEEFKKLSQPAAGNEPNFLFKHGQAPHARKGEDPLSSRGYMFLKAAAYCSGQIEAQDAKVEIETHNALQKSYVSGAGFLKAKPNSFLAPVAMDYLAITPGFEKLAAETQEIVNRGVAGADPYEVQKLSQRVKAMSFYDDATGGALVPPPSFGELIEILRNNAALVAAGAREIGMPPTGRITWPRQTDTTTAFWVGESQAVTDTEPKTGDLTLQAKKLGVLTKLPNELLRFPTVAAEAVVRADMGKVMGLAIDLALLEGEGSSVKPKGLITYSGVTLLVATTVAANGDTFEVNDLQRMVSQVEESNAEFDAFIMRPGLYNALLNRRAGGSVAGDGPFLFRRDRSEAEDLNFARKKIGTLNGYKTVKSTQVSKTRVKGAGTNLTYVIGGNFGDFLIAMSPVIEFLLANQGDTMVVNDQTWLRGIQMVDGAPRHEASFTWIDDLVVA